MNAIEKLMASGCHEKKTIFIGASMSEPHTSELNGNFCVCVCLSVSYVLVLVLTRKMVPITGRASSFLEFFFFVCTLIERKRRMGRQNNYRAINLPKVI